MRKLLVPLYFLLFPAVAFSAPISIVVNCGPYKTAQEAASAEAKVNWWDDDASDDTVCTECFAAVELRRYLCRMTGGKEDDPSLFPIADDGAPPAGDLILIGSDASNEAIRRLAPGAVANLGEGGFRIKRLSADGRNVLVIGGSTRVGTLYGVYALLEKLGVRWFAPGELHECVPRIPFDALPEVDAAEQPAFHTRGFWAWEARGNEDFFLWMARNRLNLWNTAEKNHPFLKKLGLHLTCGGHHHEEWFLGPRMQYPYNHPGFTGDEAKPPDPYPVSKDYAGDVNRNGKLQYCEAHPEWYGLRKGRRSFAIQGGGGDNFCTSNADACTELVKNTVGALIGGAEGEEDCPLLAQSATKPWAEAQWHHADSINFWTLDGGTWCECESCKALGTPTDRNLLLVHRLRQEIKKTMEAGRLKRNVQIAFLAYADVVQPPTHPLPAGFDYENCIATFFPIGRCYVHPLADPQCTELNARYLKDYTGWALDPKRHYRGQIFIGEYYNVSGFKCLPVNYSGVMPEDIPFYHRTGARHFHYMHCTTQDWGTKALTNYEMAKMLWDPRVDAASLLDDYFLRRYGAAAGPMREFYSHLRTALANVRVLKYTLSQRLNRDSQDLFPLKHMSYEVSHPKTDDGPDFVEMRSEVEEALRCLNAAASVPNLPPAEAARIAEDKGPLLYAWNTIHFYDDIIQATLLKRQGDLDGARKAFAHAKEMAKTLQADTRSCAYSSSHASAKNTFEASYITGAYYRLEAELDTGDARDMKAFDPAKGLTIYGTEFRLGGQILYDPGFRSGGKEISPKGNFVYAMQESPHHMMIADFRVAQVPEQEIGLALVGMSCPKEPETEVPIRITLNEKVLFEGTGPFPEGKLSRQEYPVPHDALIQGINRLKIENIVKSGRKGSRPWFGVDHVELLVRRPGNP